MHNAHSVCVSGRVLFLYLLFTVYTLHHKYQTKIVKYEYIRVIKWVHKTLFFLLFLFLRHVSRVARFFIHLLVYRSVQYRDIYESDFRRGFSFNFVCIGRHCKGHCRQLRKTKTSKMIHVFTVIILWFICCKTFSRNRRMRNMQ